MTQDEIIKAITQTIEDAVNSFTDGVDLVERIALNKIIDLTKELIIPALTDGDLSKNLTIVNSIKDEINGIVFSDRYEAKIFALVSSFDNIDNLLEKYFKIINKDFSPAGIIKKIKASHINLTIDQLTEDGVNANISNQVKDVIVRNLATGKSYADLTEQIRLNFSGKLLRYTETIATDSLNTYSAMYMQLATDDLGLKWFRYAGSLKTTSREWCIKMIAAKQNGLKYIHESQFQKLSEGYILGRRVRINNNTGLPYGFKAGTNASNLFVNRGGWACGHQFYPVSEAVIPQSLLNRFK